MFLLRAPPVELGFQPVIRMRFWMCHLLSYWVRVLWVSKQWGLNAPQKLGVHRNMVCLGAWNPGNSPEILEMPLEIPWNYLEFPWNSLKLPGNSPGITWIYPETTWNSRTFPWNSPGIPLKFPRFFMKFPWNSPVFPLKFTRISNNNLYECLKFWAQSKGPKSMILRPGGRGSPEIPMAFWARVCRRGGSWGDGI